MIVATVKVLSMFSMVSLHVGPNVGQYYGTDWTTRMPEIEVYEKLSVEQKCTMFYDLRGKPVVDSICEYLEKTK